MNNSRIIITNECVNKAISNNTESIDILCKKLFSLCRKTGSFYLRQYPNELDDFVQDCVFHILKRLHLFQGNSTFVTWATRVTINYALVYLRKLRSNKAGLSRTVSLDTYYDLSINSRYNNKSINSAIEPGSLCKSLAYIDAKLDGSSVIRHFLMRSSNKARLYIQHYYLEEMSFQEIAEQYCITVGAVKSSIYKALKNYRLKQIRYDQQKKTIQRNHTNMRGC